MHIPAPGTRKWVTLKFFLFFGIDNFPFATYNYVGKINVGCLRHHRNFTLKNGKWKMLNKNMGKGNFKILLKLRVCNEVLLFMIMLWKVVENINFLLFFRSLFTVSAWLSSSALLFPATANASHSTFSFIFFWKAWAYPSALY